MRYYKTGNFRHSTCFAIRDGGNAIDNFAIFGYGDQLTDAKFANAIPDLCDKGRDGFAQLALRFAQLTDWTIFHTYGGQGVIVRSRRVRRYLGD